MSTLDTVTRSSRLPSRRVLFLVPGLLVFTILFIIPIGGLLLQGFYPSGRFSLQNFQRVAESSHYMGVLIRTFRISVISTVIVAVVGYVLAYFIVFKAARKRLWILLLFVSMLVDLVVRIFGWMLIFSRGGVLSLTLQALGLVNEPVSPLYTETAIIVGIVQFCIPLMTLPVMGVLEGIDESVFEAARNLGASRREVFQHVTLPLSMDGVIAGTSLVFALSMSSFVVPQLLGGARNRMLANSVYNVIETTGDWSLAATLSIILLSVTLVLLVTFESGSRVGGA